MSSVPPPPPSHLLRSHSAPLSSLFFSDDNERLYSGDATGLVVITSTRSLRAIASWKAHTDGLLGLEEWGDQIITHGRDNKLHVWNRFEDSADSPSIHLGGSAALPGLPTPTLRYSMDVNALNYCRFSLIRLSPSANPGGSSDTEPEALIALPNLVESSLADIWALPSRRRLHAAIGKANIDSAPTEILSSDGRGSSKTGLIMSMHFLTSSYDSKDIHASDISGTSLQLLCSFENGSVTLFRFTRVDKQTSVEGIGWDAIWSVKLHVETVMAMAVSKDSRLALTVSADHLIGRYDLTNPQKSGKSEGSLSLSCVAHRTKNPGNSAISIRDDGKICAVAGWDGKIRLYSTKTLKPLGTLNYHKGGCQAVVFARFIRPAIGTEGAHDPDGIIGTKDNNDSDEDDEISEDEERARSRWLVGGGKDRRVSIWSLMSFESSNGP